MPGKRAAAAKAKHTDPDPDPDDAGAASSAGSGEYFDIRGILAEKKIKRRLHYQVDWKPHPVTNEPYPPSWEPAENVNGPAVAEWKERKSAKRANKKSAKGAKKGTETTDSEAVALLDFIPTSNISVDIPSPLSGNPSEYRTVSPDPSKEQPEAEQPEEIPDSQEDSPLPTDAEDDLDLPPDSPLAAAAVDQEHVLHQLPLPDAGAEQISRHSPLPGAGTDLEQSHPSSPRTSSGQLPSRQIEDLQGHSGYSAALVENPQSSLGLLTQVEQHFPVDGTLSSLTDSAYDGLPPVQSQIHDSHISATVSDVASISGTLASQAAQVVSILGSHSAAIRTQTQDDRDEEEEEDVIPDSVQRPREPSQASCELGAATCTPVGDADSVSSIYRTVFGSAAVPRLGKEVGILASSDNPPHSRFPLEVSSSATMGTREPPLVDAVGEMWRATFPDLFSTVSEPAVFSPTKSDGPASLGSLDTIPSQPMADLGYQQFPDIRNTVDPSDLAASPSKSVPLSDGLGDVKSEVPATVAPSDLTASPTKHIYVDLTEPEDNHDMLSRIWDENEKEDKEEPVPPCDGLEDGKSQNIFDTVTLPLSSTTRDKYLRVLAENKQTMVEFKSAVSSLQIPDGTLVEKMDAVFQKLQDFCDLPPYSGDLHSLPRDDIVKYATSTNSKFVFIHDFLQALRDSSDTLRVLIISQPGRVFEYLEAVIATSTANYEVMGRERAADPTADDANANPAVILADTNANLAQIRTEVDAVIKFDGAARSVKMPPHLDCVEGVPMTLVLVSTNTLEHIDLELGDELQGLERKNALSIVAVKIKELLRSPPDGYPEPQEAANLFADFMKNPENDFKWTPQSIPTHYLDMESTQGSKATPSERLVVGRKRSHDGDDEESSKRMKLLDLGQAAPSWEAVPMSDLLKSTLSKHKFEEPGQLLEYMAAEIRTLKESNGSFAKTEAMFREHIVTLEEQVQSYEQSLQTIQPKYLAAIGDRRLFESKLKTAKLAAKTAENRFQELRSELTAKEDLIVALQTELAESKALLLGSRNPDIAKIARLEKELDDARAKIQSLEKRDASTTNDLEFTRSRYQEASNANDGLRQENREVQARVEDLEHKADENLRHIHETWAKMDEDSTAKQLDEARAIIRERERELAVAHQELRVLKNGRRETRQGSVPRSPRTSMMSPRLGRAAAAAGTGSRGTSPAQEAQRAPSGRGVYISQPPSSARWPHLQDRG